MNPNFQAIAWMLVTGFLSISIVTLGKFLSEPPHSFHAFQVVFFYNAAALFFFVPLLLKPGFTLRTTRVGLYATRAVLEFLAFSLTFYGVSHLALPVHTAISFIAPLLGSVTAVLILKEKHYMYRWLALGVGFCGVLVVSRPWQAGFDLLPVAAMIGAALCFAFCDVCIKRLTTTESPPRVACYMVSMTALIALPFALWKWKMPETVHLPWLLLLGVMVAAVQYAVSKAFSKGDVTLILPFFFFNIVWSSLFASLLFGERIDSPTALGATIIIGATFYAAHQSRRRGMRHDAVCEINECVLAPAPTSEQDDFTIHEAGIAASSR